MKEDEDEDEVENAKKGVRNGVKINAKLMLTLYFTRITSWCTVNMGLITGKRLCQHISVNFTIF